MKRPLLETNGTALRFVENTDAVLLLELNNDLEIAKYVVGNPKQVTMEEQLQWMEKIKYETRTKRFIIEHNGESVGTIIISDIDVSNLTANMNIKLKSSARGKGIGKQSVKLALKYCFDVLELVCITAHILHYNTSSIALFESCGFTKEGIMRSRVVKKGQRIDLISFSILCDEFERNVGRE